MHMPVLNEPCNAPRYWHRSFHTINRPQPGGRLKYFMRLVAIGFAYCGGIDDRRLQREVAKMTRQERSILESIDTVLRSENVREQIRPIVERVRAELGRKKKALMTWEPIPPNVWHQPVVGRDADWTVVSFHTVVSDELIEERPDASSKDGTKKMKYFGQK